MKPIRLVEGFVRQWECLRNRHSFKLLFFVAEVGNAQPRPLGYEPSELTSALPRNIFCTPSGTRTHTPEGT